jgi:predicted ferric reductase
LPPFLLTWVAYLVVLRMNLDQFTYKRRVAYIPRHAEGCLQHSDVEEGRVSSTNGQYVFVKFDKQTDNFGWDGTTSQACDPETLVLL